MAGNTIKDITTNFGKLDKFEGHDFRRWQNKMHFLLMTLKVVYVLTTPMPELVKDATVEAIRIRAKWENDDYICRGHILNGMSDSLSDVYTNVKSAKELWDSLKSKYMAEDSSNDLSLVQLGSHLRIEESLREKVFGPSVNMTKEGGNQSWNVGSVIRLVNSKGIAVVVKRTTQILVVRERGLRTNPNTKVDAIAWWIDSGATTHVCKDHCWFKTYEPVEDGSVLYMGDDHFAHVHGKGSVALEFSSRKTITLYNVLYVPKLHKNLVSDPMLNKCEYEQVYEFDKYILSKCGVFVGFGYYNNCMFMLNLNKVPNDSDSVYMSSSSTVVNSLVWHAYLGHVHYKRMLEMSKDDLILAINENPKKCTTCMLMKITRQPFKSITRKSVIIELIYNDLCDLHATPTLGNKKYVITFIDDASRFCCVYLLHAKDEAIDKFRIYNTEVELQQNDLIKTLRTDRGGEYYDPIFFQSVGIIHETIAPYTPQQNGVAKRKNRTLKEIVNSMLSYSGLSEGFWREAILTDCYLLNRFLNKRNKTTPYELCTNEVDTTSIQVSTVSTPVSTVSSHDNTTNLSDATVYAFMANQPNGSQLVHEDLEQIHEDDLEEIDLKWQLALLSIKARSYMADDEVPTNMALMAFSDSEVQNSKTCSNTCLKSFETLKTQYENVRIEFNKSEFDLATYKRGLAFVEEQFVFYKKNEVVFCDQITILKRDALFKDLEITSLNLQIEKLKKEKESIQIKINNFENASKSLDKLIGSQINDNSRTGLGFTSYNAIAPPPTGLFVPLTIDLSNSGLEEFQQPEFKGYGPKDSKSVCVDTSNEIKKAPYAPIIED
nr:zinc finger, CCHC-type [Tanacetum cinerariifolium]